jgi:glycosyltransferase involved in cell wall biosynthesis
VRITFILPTPTMGGGTRVVSIYAQELMKRGHDVCLISPPPQRLPLGKKLKSWLKGNGWPPYRPHFPSHLDDLELDHRILDIWRPVVDDDVPNADIVIATWWETAEWVSRLSQEKGAKVYFIQHHEVYEVFPYLPVRSRETYRLPMHKVVVAQWLKQVMINEYNDQIVDVVPNGVDHAQFFAPVREKQVSPTVGLLYASAPFKGVDLSLEALKIISKNIPGLRTVCFGSESIHPNLEVPERAEFFFNPPQKEIRDLYARCDVWITASRSEGFNLPAMEAMACRTPVVSTRTGWPEEAIRPGWNGVLVNIDDADALARGIEWVLTQTDEAWRTLSLNAFETVAGSSWDVSAEMFEQALFNARNRAARGEIDGGPSSLASV